MMISWINHEVSKYNPVPYKILVHNFGYLKLRINQTNQWDQSENRKVQFFPVKNCADWLKNKKASVGNTSPARNIYTTPKKQYIKKRCGITWKKFKKWRNSLVKFGWIWNLHFFWGKMVENFHVWKIRGEGKSNLKNRTNPAEMKNANINDTIWEFL